MPVTSTAAAASSPAAASTSTVTGGSASPPGLGRLLHKYDTIAELRAARARGEPIPEKAVFKTLAGELPGALHELDRLPLPEIEARRAALREALSGGPIAPWMTAMASYHALYRAALFVKARVAKASVPDPAAASDLARAASRHASIEVGIPFVQAVARPPGGRIGAVVLAEVAAREGATEQATLRAIFPTRRDFAPRSDDPGHDDDDRQDG
jgi:hypothetical protein